MLYFMNRDGLQQYPAQDEPPERRYTPMMRHKTVSQPLQHASVPGYHHISLVAGTISVTLNLGHKAGKRDTGLSARQLRKQRKFGRAEFKRTSDWAEFTPYDYETGK